MTTYELTPNRKAKTYTIRKKENGKTFMKYRSNPQGDEYSENWTENDIKSFLRYSNDYYIVK